MNINKHEIIIGSTPIKWVNITYDGFEIIRRIYGLSGQSVGHERLVYLWDENSFLYLQVI